MNKGLLVIINLMKTYNKLVRDRIPEIIAKDGSISKTRALDDQEYRQELLKKLKEEVLEVVEAKDDKKELAKEIGDVLEVLDYIMKTFEIDTDEVVAVKAERKQSRGGFDDRIFLEYTDS